MHAFTAVGIQLLLGTILMLGAVFFVAKQRGFQVGPLGSAILKLLAISLAPAGLMSLLSPFFEFIPLGFIANLLIGFCLYFALIGLFFDLDQEDTWYCVMVIFLVNLAVSFAAGWWL